MLGQILEPSAAGPVIYEGFIPFVIDNLLLFMATMRKACYIRTVVSCLDQILILYPLSMEAKSAVGYSPEAGYGS
jgi:hypothetical protein